MDEKKQDADHLESVPVNALANDQLDSYTKMAGTFDDAVFVAEEEKAMTLMEGLKKYPTAVLWSMAIAMTVVMDGYDTALLGAFYGYPKFNEKYGDEYAPGKFTIPSRWQTGLSMASSVGAIFGILISGHLLDRFGHRRILMTALSTCVAFIFILFFAPNKPVLLVGELLIGFPIGMFSVMAPTYASEVCPVVLRGYLTTYINACWVIGQLISQGVLRGFLSRTDEWAYKIPFAIQWVWPPILIVLVYFAPDSPWWLVRTQQYDEAKKAIIRLRANKNEAEAERVVKFMIHTNELEREIESGTTYLDCFKGVDLRRTEVSAVTFLAQSASVGSIIGYSAFFFQTAGMDPANAFDLSIGQYAIGLVGTFLSWWLISYIGRRTIYVWGLMSIALLYLLMGLVSLAPADNKGAPWAVAAIQLVVVFAYDMTIGPVCYSLISELSSTRLRGKTVSLSRDLYNLWSIVNSVIYPYIMNPTAGNWKGKVGFFQFGLNIVCFVWAYFRLPEPKGRTYEELDIMFMKKVPARQFRDYVVDLADETNIDAKA